MTENKFLDIEGLKTLLWEIDKRYKNKTQAAIDAGLKFIDITNNLNKGVLTVADPDNNFHQGRYYYCSDLVKELKIGSYVADDKNIMGESKIHIVTETEIPDKVIATDSNDKWIWFDNKSILSPNSNILITICTNQNGLFLADQKTYSIPYNPEQPDVINDNYIKVTYNWSSGSTNNKPFSKTWMNQLSNCSVYYSSTGVEAETIGIDNLKEGLSVSADSTGNPYIIIKFNNDDISLKEMLYNIEFEDFYISLEDSKNITSIEYAFGGDSEISASNINLENSTLNGCSLKGLFENRQCNNITFPNKIDNITSIKNIFKNNKLFDNTNSIMSSLSLERCEDFEEAFCGCIKMENFDFLTNENWKWQQHVPHDKLLCSGMFSNTGIAEVGSVYEWLEHQIYGASEIDLSKLFMNCLSLESAAPSIDEPNIPIFSDESLNNKIVRLSEMFYGCKKLSRFPVLVIKEVQKLYCDGMFSNITDDTGMTKRNFDAFKHWDLNVKSEGISEETISFEYMFYNTPFDEFDNDKFIFGCSHINHQNSFDLSPLIDSDVYGLGGGLHLSNMFNGTCKEKPYNLYLSIYSGGGKLKPEEPGDESEFDPYLEIITINMLDAKNLDANGKYYIYAKPGETSKLYELIDLNRDYEASDDFDRFNFIT